MHTTFRSSSSEIASSFYEGLRCYKVDILVDKPSVKIGQLPKKEIVQAHNRDAKKSLISGHLISGHLEGSYTGKRILKETTRKLDFVRTLLIDNYDSYTYNIYQELSVINGCPPTVVHNDDWTWKDVLHYLYEERAFDNIVISPGPGSPTCPADIGICLQLLRECKDIPILGVCLGHQALGYVHGAQIIHAPEPVHGRLSEIEHSSGRLFHGIPSGKNSGFKVVRYHSLVIDAESLPSQLKPIAWTSSIDTLAFHDAPKMERVPDFCDDQITKPANFINGNSSSSCHDDQITKPANFINGNSSSSCHDEVRQSKRVLMGIKHSTRPHYGVQFHPESVATCHGKQLFKNFREITTDYWLKFRSSLPNESQIYHHASMQVPNADRLFREISRSRNLANMADDRNSLGSHNLVKTAHSNIKRLLKLKWRKFDHLASQIGGAESIFCELFGHLKAENTFWLDSSSIEKKRARFSFMGGKGGGLWKQLTFRLLDQRGTTLKNGGYLSIEDTESSTRHLFLENGFLDYIDEELLSYHYEEKDYEGLPFDFYGGYIGYMGYSLKVECGVSSNRHKSKTPDACFFFADNTIVIDHWTDDVYIMSINEEQDAFSITVEPWLDDTEQKLHALKASFGEKVKKDQNNILGRSSPSIIKSESENASFVGDISKEQYLNDVNKCLDFIKDGESYELCLTTQTRKAIGKDIDLLKLYLDLRRKNPSPYAAWLNFSKEDLCICSSSPERFLRLDKDGVLEAKPIKGTIRRGATLEEDEILKMKLQYSEKDQAENLMIVDLLRNDLGRVCEPGSVHVPKLMEVESYATVHTMVSTIRGEKCTAYSPIDCVRAAFPGGSMTGAPKIRSMELLDSLESCSRGIYSGCIGYFSYNKTFDLNIVIRTVVIHKGEASIGAGGAIVALSEPGNEYEEMILKTSAPVKAVMEAADNAANK